ncbi:hypothetical protein N9878_01045 [bacterium]|nr:hypothetical protein [bacterium]
MEFLKGLVVFRNNHNLNGNLNDIVTYISEEITEVRKAYWNNDIDNLIEELCDCCIYSFNGMAVLGENNPAYSKQFITDDFNDLSHSLFFHVSMLCHEVKPKSLCLIIDYCASYIEKSGYNFELAMNETVKKINSRQGAMNNDTGKWEKSVSQCKSTLYRPDYQSCKGGLLNT